MINFKVTTVEADSKNGSFMIEPLELGFGHTIGNSFRRVLLSSLEGVAITSVKIEDVAHQFSTINGVSEDVIEIVLNLKKVRIQLTSDQPVKMTLKASGKGEIKAGDIDTMGNGEIINPDLHIASLNAPTAKLNIEMTVQKGVGYVIAEESKGEEIGVIPVDAIYSPVLSVNYKVEPTRVGRSSNYDKLNIQIVTDGTISPEDALVKAAKILAASFRQIFEPLAAESGDVVVSQSPVRNESLKLSVEELDLPVRITNALKAVDIDTVDSLVNTPRNNLIKAKNLGAQSINLIQQKLAERGLSLSEA